MNRVDLLCISKEGSSRGRGRPSVEPLSKGQEHSLTQSPSKLIMQPFRAYLGLVDVAKHPRLEYEFSLVVSPEEMARVRDKVRRARQTTGVGPKAESDSRESIRGIRGVSRCSVEGDTMGDYSAIEHCVAAPPDTITRACAQGIERERAEMMRAVAGAQGIERERAEMMRAVAGAGGVYVSHCRYSRRVKKLTLRLTLLLSSSDQKSLCIPKSIIASAVTKAMEEEQRTLSSLRSVSGGSSREVLFDLPFKTVHGRSRCAML